eukprot:TRINITY_DN2779_c1_g1_i1.p1 TRINITY_DN2779_c1_g1~~TRINITY_DN2779_c1_g1_i1.p1  ORF type:complete len:908 (+),score=435.89 TRINITY_DN2779_c1_g1_i1:130-2853(+)
MKEEDRARLKPYFDPGDPDDIFILEEEIASGSFGVVYKGRHADTGAHYAVKIITPEEDEVLDDFLVEITILRKCKHHNIVGFYGAWMKGEELFIAMELCDGGAVSDIYQVCNEGLNEDQIGVVTRETLHALAYLHSVNIIHRDIKGANILLTNAGDIKLVDFGVSAELKQTGEKRNTLIGTPYWMAPEVVANKTGNVPYDTKSDIWSLGITLIELAEMNPPLHEIHPMKALMMIPMREPPVFTHPDKWSREFKDFVAVCLSKSPDKRKSAEEMLKHPWILQTKEKSVLVDLIHKRRKAESQGGEEDDDSVSDTDSDSDADGLAHGNPDSPRAQRASGTHNPVNPNTSNPEDFAASSVGSNRSTDSIPKKQTVRKDLPAGNPNRPTYRTNKKMTKRDIKAYEKDLVSKQQMKQQLKEIRKLQAVHGVVTEKQQKQHQKEKDTLVTKTETAKQNRLKQQQRDLDSLVKKHKAERENFERQSQANSQKFVKNQQLALKQAAKTTEGEQKGEHKTFQDNLKNQTKELKDGWKAQGKSLSKKDLKQNKLNREIEVEWQELVFAHKQQQAAKIDEYAKKCILHQEQARGEDDILQKKHSMEWDHLAQFQKLQAEALSSAQTAAAEFYSQMHPLEIRLMNEKHELAKSQLIEQQSTEREQQHKLLVSEFRGQTREHRKKQQAEQLALQNEVKLFVRENKGVSKAQVKAKTQELKDGLNAKQARDTKEFEERQHKQKTDEEEMVRKYQSAKLEQQKQDFDDEAKKLELEHAEQLQKMSEEHTLQTANLTQRHQQEEIELLSDLQSQEKNLQEEQQREYVASLLEFQQQLFTLVENQHVEQTRLRQKHKLEVDQVGRDQDEEKNKIRVKQEEEKANLANTKEAEEALLQKKLEQQTKVLKSIHEEGKLKRNSDVTI